MEAQCNPVAGACFSNQERRGVCCSTEAETYDMDQLRRGEAIHPLPCNIVKLLLFACIQCCWICYSLSISAVATCLKGSKSSHACKRSKELEKAAFSPVSKLLVEYVPRYTESNFPTSRIFSIYPVHIYHQQFGNHR